MINERTAPSQCHPTKFTYTAEQIASVRLAISEDRFWSYLSIAKGDERAAIRQYEFNTALSESLFGVLQGFEVAMRNSMHGALIRGTGVEDWFEHVGLKGPELQSIESAKAKILKKDKPVTPSRVVAESTFGFWVALAGRHYTESLWIPHLHKAFPRKNVGRKPAFERLASIRILRNSIAHHECILSRDIAQDYRDIIEATTWICPQTAAWIRKTTRFEACYRILFKVEVINSPSAAKA